MCTEVLLPVVPKTVKKRREDFDDAVPEGAAEAAEEEPDLLAAMLEGVMNMDNEHEEDLGGGDAEPDIDSDGNDKEDPIRFPFQRFVGGPARPGPP